jgi:hypothetical protein
MAVKCLTEGDGFEASKRTQGLRYHQRPAEPMPELSKRSPSAQESVRGAESRGRLSMSVKVKVYSDYV